MQNSTHNVKTIILTHSLVKSVSSYKKIAKLHYDIISSPETEIILRINISKRLGRSFLFYFSTLPFLASKYDKTIKIYANTKNINLFKKIGYLDNIPSTLDENIDLAPLFMQSARLVKNDEDIFKIVKEITTEAPVEMNDKLEALFISKLGEMFNNAKEHANAKDVIGMKYYKNKNVYSFCCYDTGVGMTAKVRRHEQEISNDLDALKWAMKNGNSTASSPSNPRGLGLSMLSSFVTANEGSLRICSGSILYEHSKKGPRYHTLDGNFEGTLFEMDIISDNDHKYIIA